MKVTGVYQIWDGSKWVNVPTTNTVLQSSSTSRLVSTNKPCHNGTYRIKYTSTVPEAIPRVATFYSEEATVTKC